MVWPCQACGKENSTPVSVFDSVKFNLRCRECAKPQLYRWHIMKFDPNPTDYFPAGKQMIGDLSGVVDRPSIAQKWRDPLSKTDRLKMNIRDRLARKRRPLPIPY